MKSTSQSSGKGKLKLVIITFINRHFLVKKKGCCWWKNCYFCLMLARQVLSLHYFMHCCSVPRNYGRKDHNLAAHYSSAENNVVIKLVLRASNKNNNFSTSNNLFFFYKKMPINKSNLNKLKLTSYLSQMTAMLISLSVHDHLTM